MSDKTRDLLAQGLPISVGFIHNGINKSINIVRILAV